MTAQKPTLSNCGWGYDISKSILFLNCQNIVRQRKWERKPVLKLAKAEGVFEIIEINY
jgi:hypothetical protein